MRIPLSIVVVALCVVGNTPRAMALGVEDFGNKPVAANNYENWPGAMPLINNEARVYHFWVNGNEGFYYSGEDFRLTEWCIFVYYKASFRSE